MPRNDMANVHLMDEIQIIFPAGQISFTYIRMKVCKKNIPGKKNIL